MFIPFWLVLVALFFIPGFLDFIITLCILSLFIVIPLALIGGVLCLVLAH